MKKKPQKAKYDRQFSRTKDNKIRKLRIQIEKNPNNTNAKKSLEFWLNHDRKKKT